MRLLIAAIAFICVMMVGITACQNSTSTQSTAAEVKNETASSVEELPDEAADKSEDTAKASEETGSSVSQSETMAAETKSAENPVLFDAGDFTIELPAGWTAFPQSDVFGEADENGNYPIDPSIIYVSKEAKDDWDLFSKPYVIIKYYDESTQILNSEEWYSEVEELDAEIQGVKASPAFEGISTLLEDSVWKYQILQVPLEGGQYVITVTTMQDNKDTGLSYTDKDVAGILESIKTK